MAKIASKQAKNAKPKAVQTGRVKKYARKTSVKSNVKPPEKKWQPSSKSKIVDKKIEIEYDFSTIIQFDNVEGYCKI